MKILTDIPNELLLSIIANVSPLYIESFALCCKRIYYLCIDTIREHDTVRNRLATLNEKQLLGIVFSNPRMALYPTSVSLNWNHPYNDDFFPDSFMDDNEISEDTTADVNTQALQGLYTTLLNYTYAPYAIIPLSIIRLLNVHKMTFDINDSPELLNTVAQVVEASYDPSLTLSDSLPLGRLTEAHILVRRLNIDGMELAILLAMIPTLRKLKVSNLSRSKPYSSPYQYRHAGVTEMVLEGYVDVSFLAELISRTHVLRKFTYNHRICREGAKLQRRRLVEHLQMCAGQNLDHLSLLTQGQNACRHLNCWHLPQNHNDLSLGSLRDFTVLKTLVTCVNAFIEPCDHSEYKNGIARVQRLVSWLPASLETLILYQGLGQWDKEKLRMLFQGFRNNKQTRIPKLKLIKFMQCPDFERVIPHELKTACQEVGVKLGYTLDLCRNGECRQLHEQREDWE